jgi:FAD synthetase
MNGIIFPTKMGLANLNSPRVRELYESMPSFAKGMDVTREGLVRYCRSSKADSDLGDQVLDLNRILIAFNGGKDCTVLLHMVLIACRAVGTCLGRPRLLYIRDSPDETFPEVDEFVEDVKLKYSMDTIEVENADMRSALEYIVKEHPEVNAIFMGTRSTDPNAKWMDFFCKTSPGWPEMNLIAPMLPMTYGEVWRVIHSLNLEFCSLYAQGYTSIGRRSNTTPNPELMVRNEDGMIVYAHADQLTDGSKERLGRI